MSPLRKRILILCLFPPLLLSGCRVLSEIEKAKNLTITTPLLTALTDGTYRGTYSAGVVSAAVRIGLKQGRITSVTLLEHQHGRGGAAEKIVDRIVAAQSLEIDVITGATVSSKVILKAAQNALEEGDGSRLPSDAPS